ncbi:alpha-amylase [Lachnospiraceae bacterium KM106-2]|nr:alpha-amylase [Lachnospiraceae bacterium KM106-2]
MLLRVKEKRNKGIRLLLILLLFINLALASTSCTNDDTGSNLKRTDQITVKGLDNNALSHCENIRNGAILHTFCWNFKTIKANMASIAKAGYTSIQTSPINQVDNTYDALKWYGGAEDGSKGMWWWYYQPTDWKIGNYQLGTRDDFKEMCEEADRYGIKVIVDVVPNHTAQNKSKVAKELIDAAGGKLYHDTGLTKCENYSDRLQCTRYSMDGKLPDVDTENKGFQDYFIHYLDDCIACGADGFRYDTAKHIGLADDDRPNEVVNNFWKRVTTEITEPSKIFSYGEVLQGDNERITEYVKELGAATASGYGYKIRECIKQGTIDCSQLRDYQVDAGVDTSKLVTWVESHDNYINDGTWKELTNAQIKLGWALIGARKDGAPLFFDRPANGGPDDKWGDNVIGPAGSDLYKDTDVVAINQFRNAMEGEKETLRNLDQEKQVLMIERGKRGIVLINLKDSDYQVDTSCSFKKGDYSSMTANKSKFTADGEKITGKIPAKSFVVLVDEDKSEEQEQKITVHFNKPEEWKDTIYAYVYNENGEELQKWPGNLMEKEKDGSYSFSYEEDYENPLIIFTDGEEQVPEVNQKGFSVENNGVYNDKGFLGPNS